MFTAPRLKWRAGGAVERVSCCVIHGAAFLFFIYFVLLCQEPRHNERITTIASFKVCLRPDPMWKTGE